MLKFDINHLNYFILNKKKRGIFSNIPITTILQCITLHSIIIILIKGLFLFRMKIQHYVSLFIFKKVLEI